MISVLNQFRRIYTDDGRDDRTFDVEERRLKWSLANLQKSIDLVVVNAQKLHDLLLSSTTRARMH